MYSVPHELIDERVWARIDGQRAWWSCTSMGSQGPRRSPVTQLTTPGRPAICDEHYPPRPAGALERRPRARSAEEREFLALGEGAERWLIKAAAAGAQRVRRKMAEAVDLAKLHGTAEVERALRTCADAGRFADGDLAAILAHQQQAGELILFPALRGALAAALDPQLGGIRTMNHPESHGRRYETDGAERRSAALRARSPRPIPLPRKRPPPTPDRGQAMTVKPPAPPPLPRRARGAAAPAAAPIRSPRGAGGDRQRDRATLGTRRGPAGPARRGSRRPRPGDDPDATPRLRAAGRQDVRRLGAGPLRDPSQDPASAPDAGMDRPRRGAVRLRPERDRQEPPGRSARPLAIDKGKTVAWHTLETLAQLLRRHRADDSVNKAIAKLIRADLVVIDDVGLLPVSADAAEALFRVIDAAYEKRSIAISSNIHPSGFDELMPKSIATATVDRLLHHAHVLITEGQDSYRLAQATAGKGVKPLT